MSIPMGLFKAELHMHSLYSGETDIFLDIHASVENIAKECVKKNIRILSITDHNTIQSYDEGKYWARKLNLLFIPGCEVSTAQGHVLAYGIKKPLKQHLPLRTAISAIHEQGGIAVAAHPFQLPIGCTYGIWTEKFDAVEGNHAYAIGNTTTQVFNSLCGKKPIVAGSDAHFLDEIGLVYTLFPDWVENFQTFKKAIRGGYMQVGGTGIGFIRALIRRLKEGRYKDNI